MARIEMNGVLHLHIGKDLMSAVAERYPPDPALHPVGSVVKASWMRAAGLAVIVTGRKPGDVIEELVSDHGITCRTGPIPRCRPKSGLVKYRIHVRGDGTPPWHGECSRGEQVPPAAKLTSETEAFRSTCEPHFPKHTMRLARAKEQAYE